jgi:hypothetical protein
MAVANLPAIRDPNLAMSPRERWLEGVLRQIALGKRPDRIAREIHPRDPRKRRRLRDRIWYLLESDANFHSRVAGRAHAELVLALMPTTVALAGRASRGRVDAAKLIYEASGFHNSRVRHEHSGEISIKLDMPRPKYVEPEVVDADVVDD